MLRIVGLEDDLERVRHESVFALQVDESPVNQLGIFGRTARVGQVSLQLGLGEIDIVEIDDELFAIGLDPALDRQDHVLDLIVQERELEAGGIGPVRIGVVVDLLVEMTPELLVADLPRLELGPVVDWILRAAFQLKPQPVDPELVHEAVEDWLGNEHPGAVEPVPDLVIFPQPRRRFPPGHDLIGDRGIDHDLGGIVPGRGAASQGQRRKDAGHCCNSFRGRHGRFPPPDLARIDDRQSTP